MTTNAGPARVAVARTIVRGIQFGALCGLAGGPIVVVVVSVLSSMAGGSLDGLVIAFYGLIPAGIVGGVVGAGVGLVGSAVASLALVVARMSRASDRAAATAAAVGAGLGAGAAIAVVGTMYVPSVALVWLLPPVVAAFAARIGWGSAALPLSGSGRERWSWRALLAGFALGVVALVQSLVLLADPYWWSWDGDPHGPRPTAAIVALVIVAPTAAVLLVAGAWLASRLEVAPVATVVLGVALLAMVTAVGASGLVPRQQSDAVAGSPGSAPDNLGAPDYLGSSDGDPAYPDGPDQPDQVDQPDPAEPLTDYGFAAPRSNEATTAFTLDRIVDESQAQIDGTIAAAGPIDDPATPAGTTTFPAGIGGCGNVAGGRVTFEVWFLVDDLEGGFARARDAWVAQGFALDPGSTADRVGVTGGPDSAIDLMTLESKEGTVRFTVQSVCVAGEDY